MSFEDSSDNLEKDASLNDFEGEEELSDYEIEQQQAHRLQNKFSLEVRRAIEDHLENSRLQKEFDYLYDDDFGPEEDTESRD